MIEERVQGFKECGVSRASSVEAVTVPRLDLSQERWTGERSYLRDAWFSR